MMIADPKTHKLHAVSFTYEPIAISADADAFLDDVLAAG